MTMRPLLPDDSPTSAACALDPAMAAFIDGWAAAGPELEAMRTAELRHGSVALAMEQLASMVDSAIFLKPLVPYSGLVDMQRVFASLRATLGLHE